MKAKPSMRMRLKRAEVKADSLNTQGGKVLHDFELRLTVLARRCDDLEEWCDRSVRVKVFDWVAGLFR